MIDDVCSLRSPSHPTPETSFQLLYLDGNSCVQYAALSKARTTLLLMTCLRLRKCIGLELMLSKEM